MPHLWGSRISKQELLEHVGDVSQVGGIRNVRLQDGPEDQVRQLEFRTGSGLDFDVVPGRCFDIGAASYKGVPLAWRSGVRERHPAYFEAAGAGWLRSFGGGLLVTCGLTQVGSGCDDNGQQLPIHGRISSTPAYDICISQGWEGDDYLMRASGKMREVTVFGENLLLERTISAKLGEERFAISDRVTNDGHASCPHMILYHFNLGFPLVERGSRVFGSIVRTKARDDDARDDEANWHTMGPPDAAFREKVYFHDVEPDAAGRARVALKSANSPRGVGGLYIDYDARALPRLIQWKMNGAGTYVCGLEPANCLVMGRVAEREAGTLVMLEPGQSRSYSLEVGVLKEQGTMEAR